MAKKDRWYVVENVGVADVNEILLLGVSSSRRKSEKIGQFGSGIKHAILTLMRHSVRVMVNCGGTSITPFARRTIAGDQVVDRAMFKVTPLGGRSRTETSSMTLDYGELDWGEVGMAMREIVSNAIDAGGGWEHVKIYTTDELTSDGGATRVYIEHTPDVEHYFERIKDNFLHVEGQQHTRVLDKMEPSLLRVYRKGVLCYSSDVLSMYNYNDASGELRIDESRKLDSYSVFNVISQILGDDVSALERVLRSVDDIDCVETKHINKWYMRSEKLKSAWDNVHGSGTLLAEDDTQAETVRRHGFKSHVVSNMEWRKALIDSGVTAATTRMSVYEKKGHTVFDAGVECREGVRGVWLRLWESGLLGGKCFPQIKEFVSSMNQDDEQTWGYQEGDTIYLHRERRTDAKVILEELAHYITGCGDTTRGFQDFAFRVAAILLDGGIR